MDTAIAEALASELHQRAALAGPPFDMEALAAALGYEVEWVAPGELGRAVGFCWGRSIFVSPSLVPGRNAWTLAHELAHAEADRLEIPHGEVFVDRCAAELLMPRALFARATAVPLPTLAEAYGVSLEAAGRRVVDVSPALLAVVDDGRRRRARRLFRSKHTQAPEPVAIAAYALARRAAKVRTASEATIGTWRLGAWLTPQLDRAICLAVELEQPVLDAD